MLQTGPHRPRVPCPCPWPPLLQSPSKEPWLGCVVTAGGRRPASLHPYSLCWVLAPPWGGRCPQGGGREPLACTLPARSSSFLRGLFPEPGGGDSPGGVAGLGVPAGQAPWDGVRRHSPSCGGSWSCWAGSATGCRWSATGWRRTWQRSSRGQRAGPGRGGDRRGCRREGGAAPRLSAWACAGSTLVGGHSPTTTTLLSLRGGEGGGVTLSPLCTKGPHPSFQPFTEKMGQVHQAA